MKRFLIVAAAFLLSHQPAQATDISVVAEETSEHPAIILIKGLFAQSEDKKDVAAFTAIATAQKKPPFVFLESPGGLTWTGVNLGRVIRERGLTTGVADNAQCSSACALVWMGGKERLMGRNARIGFHATKSPDNSISPHGNAVVGAYLHEVGISPTESG